MSFVIFLNKPLCLSVNFSTLVGFRLPGILRCFQRAFSLAILLTQYTFLPLRDPLHHLRSPLRVPSILAPFVPLCPLSVARGSLNFATETRNPGVCTLTSLYYCNGCFASRASGPHLASFSVFLGFCFSMRILPFLFLGIFCFLFLTDQ